MGLFDFMSVAGEDEITEKAEVSQDRINALRQQNISKSIAKLDVDGEQVEVSVEGEVATVTGSAPDQAAMEKIVLCAGNQHGIGRVDCRIEVATPPAAAAATARSHRNSRRNLHRPFIRSSLATPWDRLPRSFTETRASTRRSSKQTNPC